MRAREFLDRCTPDCRDRLTLLIVFINKIVEGNKVNTKYQVCDKKNTIVLWNGSSATIFYFIYILFYTKSDVGLMLEQNGSNLDELYNISDEAKQELDKIIDNIRNISDEELDECFGLMSWANVLLTTFTNDIEGNITLERLFLNIIPILKNVPKLNEVIKTDVIEDKIEALAKTKEKQLIIYSSESIENGKIPESIKKLIDAKKRETESKPNNIEVKEKTFNYGEELTKKDYSYNPLVGRTKELRTLGALLMDDEKSIIIHGNPGVGKTTLVKGLAYKIQRNEVPESLRNKRVFEISAAEMIAGTALRGQFESRLLNIINRLIEIGNSILFIDEIHTIMGLGNTIESNTNDAAQILKPYLGDGRLKIIGGTTTEEYNRFIRGTKSNNLLYTDKAFNRRFIGLELKELTYEELENLIITFINRCETIKSIGFDFDENTKKEIINLLLELSHKEYQNKDNLLYNPDFALTILRFCYDFALYDGKVKIDTSSLIEGIEFASSSGYISNTGEEYFKEKIHIITKQ